VNYVLAAWGACAVLLLAYTGWVLRRARSLRAALAPRQERR
jgi:heme exporter protein CcmD